MKRLALLIALASIVAYSQGISGTATLTVIQQGSTLLAGCNFIGAGGCTLPSGWSLVMQQDFECSNSHANPANPSCSVLPSAEVSSISQVPNVFEQTQVHSGSFAFGGTYTADGDQVNLIYGNGNGSGSSSNVGSFTSLYLSWWEFTDPNALYGNSDYYIFHIGSPTLCAGILQDMAYDAQPVGGGGSPPSNPAEMLPIANGQTGSGGCQGFYQYGNGDGNLNMNPGTWRHVEALYTPSIAGTPQSTDVPASKCLSSSQANCGNGAVTLWINGQQQLQSLNANLNGTVNMANSFIEIGGVITDFCTAPAGTRANPFSLCPNAAPSAFHRYFDDIIILKQ